jgi:hypothetical protein
MNLVYKTGGELPDMKDRLAKAKEALAKYGESLLSGNVGLNELKTKYPELSNLIDQAIKTFGEQNDAARALAESQRQLAAAQLDLKMDLSDIAFQGQLKQAFEPDKNRDVAIGFNTMFQEAKRQAEYAKSQMSQMTPGEAFSMLETLRQLQVNMVQTMTDAAAEGFLTGDNKKRVEAAVSQMTTTLQGLYPQLESKAGSAADGMGAMTDAAFGSAGKIATAGDVILGAAYQAAAAIAGMMGFKGMAAGLAAKAAGSMGGGASVTAGRLGGGSAYAAAMAKATPGGGNYAVTAGYWDSNPTGATDKRQIKVPIPSGDSCSLDGT